MKASAISTKVGRGVALGRIRNSSRLLPCVGSCIPNDWKNTTTFHDSPRSKSIWATAVDPTTSSTSAAGAVSTPSAGLSRHQRHHQRHHQQQQPYSMAPSSWSSSTTSHEHHMTPTTLNFDDPESRRAMQSFLDALALVNVNRLRRQKTASTPTRSDPPKTLWNTILDNSNDDAIMQRRLQGQLQYRNEAALQELHVQHQPSQLQLMTGVETSIVAEGNDGDNEIFNASDLQSREDDTNVARSIDLTPSQTTALASNNTRRTLSDREAGLLEAMDRSLRRHLTKRSLELFQIAKRQNVHLTRKQTSDLFFLVVNSDPLKAYSILKYYNQHPVTVANQQRKKLSMYKRMCSNVSLLDPKYAKPARLRAFVESLLDELEDMDEDYKQALYPTLIVSLATQRSVFLGPYAGDLYRYMKNNNFEMKLGWLTKILSLSKYNRQEDLPFHDVLAQLAALGGTPAPMSVLPAIHNMFPYTDVEQMIVVLKAYLQLEDNAVANHHDQLTSHQTVTIEMIDAQTDDLETTNINLTRRIWSTEGNILKIDLSTLEMISAGAAQAGNSELILLVWDVMELCCYEPTEPIFENTVLAFAGEGRHGLRQAFAAMASMKEDGFVPSRPLIRSFCFAIRHDKRIINHALQILLDDQATVLEGSSGTAADGVIADENSGDDMNEQSSRLPLLSLESLNVVLSCLGERGDADNAMEMLDIFKQCNIQPNEDSYSFAMEALGKDLHRRLSSPVGLPSSAYLYQNLDLAGTLVSRMEGHGLSPSSDVIRNYVELLCLANEVETATAVVEDCLSVEEHADRVGNRAIYRVALSNAESGNFAKAKQLAKMTSEVIPVLSRKIKSMEQRQRHMEEVKRRQEAANDTDASGSNDS